MIVIAHVAGLPVEELIPTVAGAGSMLLLARSWVSLRLRRHRRPSGRAAAPRFGSSIAGRMRWPVAVARTLARPSSNIGFHAA